MQMGQPTWKSFDWMGIHQMIFDLGHESVQQGKIPYHYTGFDVPVIGSSIESGTNGSYNVQWFSMGGPNVSPQTILFAYFQTPIAMTLNMVFFFSLGFWGILLWIRKLKLSDVASVFLFISWCFSGFIVTRMGVGHLGWCNAYLFIPLYFWLLYKFIEGRDLHWKNSLKNALLFSLFIFFTKLNGNGINTSQFLLVGLIVMLFYHKHKRCSPHPNR
ncbi:MAG: hypothetical protein HOL05_05755 [Nitrospinaceae bacterium]|nr:hypothetical protein [Nitrospinaceae bacterium]